MVLPRLRPYVEAADAAVRAALPRTGPPALGDAVAHYPLAGGKRLRPALALLAAEAAGGTIEDALPFAAALELVHDFSLVHDDVMDRDDLRRGLPTVHKRWGEPLAILAGDALLARAFEIVTATGDASGARLARELAGATRVLCEGQALDMDFERRDATPAQYREMIRAKTARLFEAATRGGGLAAGTTEATAEALAGVGRAFGMAFQIHDDLLDLLVATEARGKRRGSDVRAGKKTLVLLLARDLADAPGQATLDALVGKRDASEADVDAVVAVLGSSGALAAAQAERDAFTREAISSLEALPPSPARDLLADLARWAATRTS